jgi:cysteine desulfurase family protein (TIGR01976 family)
MNEPRSAKPERRHGRSGRHTPDAGPRFGSVASVDEIRSHFPALERRFAERSVAYFDGPGGTQVPHGVVDAMSAYLFHHNANTHWVYPTSVETDELIAASRETLGRFLNASAGEICFGANMTTLTFHLARALGRNWGPGDEILVTELDHHANVDPWRALEKERGVSVRAVRMDPATGELDWEDLERAFTPRTRLLAIGAASNALGTISDVAAAARLAHEAGALCFVDAVHYAPHELVDVRAIDCDFLACSAYKFYGPHIDILYGRGPLLESLDAPKLAPAPDAPPEKLETGTQNHEGMIGAAAAVRFLADLTPRSDNESVRGQLERSFAALHSRGQTLARQLWNGLAAVDGVTLYGPPPNRPRTPTVAFTVAGHSADDVAIRLVERSLFLSSGDFYATTLVDRIGQSRHGVVRAGCACYTSEQEIERLIAGVAEIAR